MQYLINCIKVTKNGSETPLMEYKFKVENRHEACKFFFEFVTNASFHHFKSSKILYDLQEAEMTTYDCIDFVWHKVDPATEELLED